MNITLKTTEIIEDIYADSALQAVLRRRGSDSLPALLTDDHREALLRAVVTATAMTAGELAGRLQSFAVSADESEITFGIADTGAAKPEALTIHLDTAVKFATMYLVAINAGDSLAAENYLRCMISSASAVTAALDRPTCLTLRPSYL